MKVTLFHCGPAVNESERTAFQQIKSRLISVPGDDEWVLLTNLTFSATHRLQSDEIDVVAIGPPGVRVIEIKHWTASWADRRPDLVEREADRVTNKARKIGTTLRKKVPSLGRVDGAFLVTGASAKVSRFQGRVIRGAPFHTLKTWQDVIGLGSPRSLSPQEVRMLARALAPKSEVAVDGTLKRLAGYTRLDLQTPRNERFHRVYRGTHASRQDRVVLHLYDLSASDDPKAEPRARREFEALLRLQLYGWAPRILESYQDAPGYEGEITFFTLADPAAPCIEERASDDEWDTTARLDFARSAVRALGELHQAGEDEEPMVHRNITRRTLLVKHDNSPILIGFEHARIPAHVSVGSADPSANAWDDAVAPEIRAQGRGAADHRSDVYSLCACLAMLFPDWEDDPSAGILDTLAKGMAKDPEARITLQDVEAALSGLLGESVPPPPPPPARFWTEDQIIRFRDEDYRIVSRLGSGGIGTTFKVVGIDRTTKEELGAYVAKVVPDEATGRRVLRAYKLARSHLRHSALSTIFEAAAEWRDNAFVALMTWIEGEPLSEYTGLLQILAEDFQEASDEVLALRWLRTACEALDVLHRNGLVHGDLSPRNMIVSRGELVLTDYDFVSKINEPAVAPGTVLYCSPSSLESRFASPSDDIYALAASFFQVLFEKEPFQYGGALAKERGLNWEDVERDGYPTVAAFLSKATAPSPEHRFTTVTDALAVLNPPKKVEIRSDGAVKSEADDTIPPESDIQENTRGEQQKRYENEVDWLRSLLQSYPGSRYGNSETRGLDTDFAARTYVETDLERALYHDIRQRRISLVILCGNAGDGKTALLQHLAQSLGLHDHTSVTRILEVTIDDGFIVRMNLDGSASWEGRSADDLLDKFLAPFQHGRPNKDIVHLLAINDGRLLEWIEGVESRRGNGTALTEELYDCLQQQESPPDSHIRFISLNQRSLVGSPVFDETRSKIRIEHRFLDRLLDSLYGGEEAPAIWKPCETCAAQARCEIRRAARMLGPEGLPGAAGEEPRARARKRLFEMLQAVHLRGETHITIRELRAALVYILFGVHFCRDYHDDSKAPLPYWDRAFSPEAPRRQGDLLRELIRLDPALETHPHIDRYLLRAPSGNSDDGAPHYPDMTLESARRRAYFEWTEEDIKALTQDLHALDLAQGRHFLLFRDLPTINEDAQRKLCSKLCEGISRLEGLPPLALDRSDVVPLRITPRTPTETAFWVEKNISAFHLETDLPSEAEGFDRLHRQAFLVYRYRNGREERLRLGAELFHLLLELSEGYQLGDVSTDDTFAHLSIFVQRLVREDDRAVFAWNPMRDDAIFEVSARLIKSGDVDVRQQMVIQPRKMTDGGQK